MVGAIHFSLGFLKVCDNILGFKNMGEMWKDDFESPTFVKDMDELWSQVEPLYKELHSFVSRKLKARYGDKLDVSDGFIPAHALGRHL